jgi:2-oxoglutarate/2-oxoacid ferredoxin oxidoreductase subunit beta
MKMANHRLNVFVFTGDGDSLGEGGNHLMHTCRRNHDITILLHNNGVYALTTGQTSPASSHGYKSKSTPAGNPDQQLFPSALAIASGATFVAREYSTNINKLTELMIEANNHRGLAVIDILQPCVTFNHECTHTTYQDNTYHLGDDYDPTNKKEAFMKAMEWGVKQIPLGIIYREEKPSYESSITQIKEKPLIEHNPQHQNVEALLKKYT